MLDGRQVAVIAHATNGDITGALDLLNDTEPGEPWENAVAACLRLHCRGPNHADVATLLHQYHDLDAPGPGLSFFHTRLALSFIDTLDAGHPRARQIIADAIDHAIAAEDGYAAQDVLNHDGCRAHLTAAQTRILADQVESCALGCGAIPAAQLAEITAALANAEQTITRTLAHALATQRPPM